VCNSLNSTCYMYCICVQFIELALCIWIQFFNLLWPCVQFIDHLCMTFCAVHWPSMYDVLCSLSTSMTFYAVYWSRWPFVHLVDPLWPLVQFIDRLWPFMQFIDLDDLVCSLLTLMTLCAVRWPPYDLLCSSLTLMTLCAVSWPPMTLYVVSWPSMTFCAVH
jgi:hypothetical protein